MKSPNMMSTIGRIPVIAAPTASPVNPASEIGVSNTRSLPNSSSSPESTLNGVPASATSSPRMHTVWSRRISSASASRIACANVSSRTVVSGINVVAHLIRIRIRRGNREFDRFLHLRLNLRIDRRQLHAIRDLLLDQPLREIRDRIALRFPRQFFLLRPVVFAIDVAHMMPVIPIRVAKQKRGSSAAPRPTHQPLSKLMDCTNVLPIDSRRLQPESSRARQDVARCRLLKVRVLGIKIVLADVNHRQLEELRQVHHFVQHTLSQRTLAKEANRHRTITQTLRRERSPSSNPRAATHNRIRSQVAGSWVRDVHRPALTLAVSSFFPQQFREHSIRRSAFRQTMSMPTMGAGDVVAASER